jgi:hypothetical protein
MAIYIRTDPPGTVCGNSVILIRSENSWEAFKVLMAESKTSGI